ncbi:MAG: hypothetical protein N4J56_007800 [Chroococcidiopsis sp. SAG 2025]|nr:hypothetical protein [Chroococcidiopsis sp. SAG 2025]
MDTVCEICTVKHFTQINYRSAFVISNWQLIVGGWQLSIVYQLRLLARLELCKLGGCFDV